MPPLPHYPSNKPIVEPIYSNLFDFVIVTDDYSLSNLSSDVKYNNSVEKNIIDITFYIDESNFAQINFNNFLKNIKYVIHTVHDKKGKVLGVFLVDVKFINMSITFSHYDSKLLSVFLNLENLKSNKLDHAVDDNYIRSLQRDLKLGFLFSLDDKGK